MSLHVQTLNIERVRIEVDEKQLRELIAAGARKTVPPDARIAVAVGGPGTKFEPVESVAFVIEWEAER